MPNSSHPLAAYRRFGTVAGISNVPNTIDVNIGGDNAGNDYDSGNTWPCAYDENYIPRVGDTVMLLGVPGDYVVVGTLEHSATGKIVGLGTGPNAQTDFGTGGGTAVTLNVPVVSGRNYLPQAYLIGTWITAVGLWTAKINVGGVEINRLSQDNHATGIVAAGSIGGWVWTAPSTTTATFTLTSQASSGANRISANACQLSVMDCGAA